MKSLNHYIIENEISTLNESLLSKLTGWFKDLFKSQETLEDKTLKVDVKNLKSPDKPTKLKDIENNKEEMKLLNDPKVGFPTTSMLINQKNKYLTYEDAEGNSKEFDPLVNRYFYIEGNNKYDVGIIMYDDHIKNDNNYVNIINIEVINQIENKQEVMKLMHNIFEETMKKNNFKGSQYIIKHPNIKGTLIQLQYTSENNNKDILFKNFK